MPRQEDIKFSCKVFFGLMPRPQSVASRQCFQISLAKCRPPWLQAIWKNAHGSTQVWADAHTLRTYSTTLGRKHRDSCGNTRAHILSRTVTNTNTYMHIHYRRADGSAVSFSRWYAGEPDQRDTAQYAEADNLDDPVWIMPASTSPPSWSPSSTPSGSLLPSSHASLRTTSAKFQCGVPPGSRARAAAAQIAGSVVIFGGTDSLGRPLSGPVHMHALTPADMSGKGVLSSVSPTDAGAAGSMISVLGDSLCAGDARIFIGATPCDVTRAVSDTQMQCIVPQGVGSRLPVRVWVKGTWASWSTPGGGNMFTYAPARVDRIVPSIGVVGGGDLVTVIGTGFGPQSAAGMLLMCSECVTPASDPCVRALDSRPPSERVLFHAS